MAPTNSGCRPASSRIHASAASLASRVVIIEAIFRTVVLKRAHSEPVEPPTTVADNDKAKPKSSQEHICRFAHTAPNADECDARHSGRCLSQS